MYVYVKQSGGPICNTHRSLLEQNFIVRAGRVNVGVRQSSKTQKPLEKRPNSNIQREKQEKTKDSSSFKKESRFFLLTKIKQNKTSLLLEREKHVTQEAGEAETRTGRVSHRLVGPEKAGCSIIQCKQTSWPGEGRGWL